MPQATHLLALLFRMLPTIHTALSGLIFSAWSLGLLLVWHYRPCYPRLSTIKPSRNQVKTLPKLSVVVPACNEAETVESAMRSLLALDYPDLEIIAIDDR